MLSRLTLNKFLLIVMIATLTADVRAMLFSVNNAEMMLSFRTASGGKNVQVDIGTVTNLLNLAAGASTNFLYAYNTNQVRTNFGNSYSAVLFNVAGATKIGGNPTRVWLTDSDVSTPVNFSSGDMSTIRSLVQSLGTQANLATANIAGSNYVGAASASASYSYIVSGGLLTSIDTWGGALPFVTEILAGGSQNFYEFNIDDSATPAAAKLIGSFSMSASTGIVTFTRASSGAVVIPPAFITGCVRATGNSQVSFTTTNGVSYQLLYKTNLSQASWITNGTAGVLSGNNAIRTFTDTTTDAQRYYRVQSF